MSDQARDGPRFACEAILIDLDGVIRHWPSSDEPIEAACGLAIGSIRRAAFSPELVDLAITGAISDEEWRARIADKLHHESGSTQAHDAVARWTAQPGIVDRQVLSLLARCHPSVNLVLVTNATSRLCRDLEALGLSERFHVVVNSSDIGAKKPAEHVFRTALLRAGAAVETALFVDDTLANIATATALGMRSHLFVSHDELSSFLRQAGALRA